MKLTIRILAVLALVVAVAVSAVFISYSPAHAFQGAQPPAKPAGLSVSPTPGSLDVGVDWDEVDGAAEYWVRWRFVQPDHKLNEGVRVGSSATTITLAEYGEWVVRVQACNDTGCGAPLAKRFAVEPASEPTLTPEPTSTPEPTPEPTPEATPEPTPELQVSIAADATELEVNEEVTLAAVFTNAPADSSPTYRWQLDLGGGSWHSSGTEATFSYLQSNAASTAFRVAVTYGSGASATSDPIIITWGPPNRAPAVDDRSEHYAGFTGAGNAPRGTLVSKIYDGIFSDPDGDTLTYTVSVPAAESGRVDTVYIQEEIQRVFIRLDAENDWGTVTPVLADPVVTTVTLTATDPDGLSASVTGEFHTNWESSLAPLAVCDRTPQVRDALAALADKDCEDVGAGDLSQVVKLDLSNTGLRSLKSGDFNGMSALRKVDISGNTAMSWSDVCGADKWGASVHSIDLIGNRLGGSGAAMPGDCFAGAPNLEGLYLIGNGINSLPANAFGNPAGSPNTGDPSTRLTKLRFLDLGWNQIPSLPANVFDGLGSLKYLDLGRNALTSLPANVFDGLGSLRYLDLGRNALTSTGLPANVFSGVSSLWGLELDNQYGRDSNDNLTLSLTGIPSGLFDGLTSLEELDLAYNGITSTGLPDNLFSQLTGLEELALFGNPGSPFTLTDKGVRSEASVTQVVTSPTGFTVEPVSGGVKLSWDKPTDTSISHQYRYDVNESYEWTVWADIGSPTTSGSKLEHTVSSGLTSGNEYLFQLRMLKDGAGGKHADAGCGAVFGTSGNDTLNGSGYESCIVGLDGNDTLTGGDGIDKLEGGEGDDTLIGYDDDDTLEGGAGDDTLWGGLHDDKLDGGDGDDKLASDYGDNTFSGGNGADEFYFYIDFGAVTISDYTSGEKIWICIGTGQGNGNGQVRWTGQASGSDWEITVNSKYNNGKDVTEGTITLTGVSTDPGSDIAWSDPNAKDGTGCDLLP